VWHRVLGSDVTEFDIHEVNVSCNLYLGFHSVTSITLNLAVIPLIDLDIIIWQDFLHVREICSPTDVSIIMEKSLQVVDWRFDLTTLNMYLFLNVQLNLKFLNLNTASRLSNELRFRINSSSERLLSWYFNLDVIPQYLLKLKEKF